MTTDLKLLKEIMFRSNLHGCAWGWRHRRSIVAISVGWKLTGVWKTNPSLTTGSLSRINSGWGFLYEHQKHAAAHLLTFKVFPFLWSKTKIIVLWTHHNTLSLSIQFLSVSFREPEELETVGLCLWASEHPSFERCRRMCFFSYFLRDLISPPPTWNKDVWIMDPPPTGKHDPAFCGETPFYQLILKGCLYFSWGTKLNCIGSNPQ